MKSNSKDVFLANMAVFTVGALALLLALSYACKRWVPSPIPESQSAGEFRDDDPTELTWWQRLKKKFEVPRIKRRLQRDNTSKAKPKTFVEGQGLASTVTDRDQLLLRQKILAEIQLADCEGRPPMTVLKRTQLPYGAHPWKAYEVDRLRTAIFADLFEEGYNERWLKPLIESANRAAGSDFANFEDFFWAGRANLFAGNLRQSRNYLQIAKRRWPIKSGLLYGMTELMLAVTDALSNKFEAMERRVEGIRTVFPDWFYSEIYQPDFEYLEGKYPNEPVIFVLHGLMLAMGSNDAEAMRLYRKALALPKLKGDAKLKLKQWLRTLEKVHGS